MKTIQIPTTSNPFIVNINNHVYTYTAGDTAEVPDEVAEAIEDALELVPRPGRKVTKIGQLVDGSLSTLTESDLGGITAITGHAFYKGKQLQCIEIPDDVTIIEACAFYGCEKLETVRFGEGSKIKNIGAIAFQECVSLSKIYLPANPPVLYGVDVFGNIKASCVFYCKTQSSLDAYKAAPNWSTLTGTYAFVVEA